MGNVITNDSLYLMSSLIAEGKVPSSVSPLLTAAGLIALPKSNAEIRPIAIGEVIRRVTAKAVCLQMSTAFSSFFHPIQHGIATPGGAELLIHHVEALLEDNPKFCAVM